MFHSLRTDLYSTFIASQWCAQCNRLHTWASEHTVTFDPATDTPQSSRGNIQAFKLHTSFQTELLGSLESIGWVDTHLGLWVMDEKKTTLVAASKNLTNELCYVICWWHKIESSCTQLISASCSHIILHWDFLQMDRTSLIGLYYKHLINLLKMILG